MKIVFYSEVYIGIYGVLAQSESENISANVKWGIHKRMQNGTYACHFHLLGYRRDKATKEIRIVQEEAEVVRKIFRMYLQGMSLDQIKAYLESMGIRTVNGKTAWDKNGLKAMLTNEKYVGDVMYQKTYRENCISKKTKINRGEVDRYLVTDNHPAIIDRETFRLVKREMVRRSSKRRTSGNAITENESTVENMLSVNGCSAISAAVPFGERHGQETGKRRPIGDA